ncbi:unnamed protein product [Lactuca saligna]|uniref:ATPase F1/V1/A1 complex alpha/beta subunit N-terminal domain-containing protein n=1 Tax=Lactuca saligna TaxID=75948 RepID=A0AA35Z6D8_LACSI|nr:unnamed protein product [Lactuca saligna]
MVSRRLAVSLSSARAARALSQGVFGLAFLNQTPSQSHPSPTGNFLNHVVNYATSTATAPTKLAATTPGEGSNYGTITNEFIGTGAIGQVCQVIGAVADVRCSEGLPPILRHWRFWTTRSD